jgi:integrase
MSDAISRETEMATFYQKDGMWYLSVTHAGKRITRSLRTKDKEIANQLRPIVESQLLAEVTGIRSLQVNISFKDLSERYLSTNKQQWATSTYDLNRLILQSQLDGKPLPANPTSRAIYIRHINACWNWGLKNKLIDKAFKIPGDTKGEFRMRTYTHNELKLMFSEINDESFNAFVRFAYYTGARSGEIRCLSRENVLDESLVVKGKTGSRMVKLNSQAQEIIKNQDPFWSYRKDFVSHKFKKEVRRLGIKNARFHDLRRTFGLNLIKQGMSIYKVSKLLGHSSVRTTEQHYAPLLTVEIEDFEL